MIYTIPGIGNQMQIFTKTASCQCCNNQHFLFDYYGFVWIPQAQEEAVKMLEKGQISDQSTILKGFLSIVSIMKYFCRHFSLKVLRAKRYF